VSKALIFSDVHLKVSPGDRPRHARFVRFLKSFDPQEYRRIVCVGDLFDFWFEYRHVVFSGYFEVLRAFADLRDAGCELHLICGNHDFWGGRFLHEELGFHIHPDRFETQFGEQRALFVHGDGINPADRSYRIYKRFARNPLVVEAFRLIHPDLAMKIAQGVSHGSRSLKREEDPANGPEALALQAFGRSVLERGEADIVFCGHAHAPVRVECPTPRGPGAYINTGDWFHHYSYVTWDGAAFSLRRWEQD
jgi:UDP-2,3-diacylglucosamine hydrolase